MKKRKKRRGWWLFAGVILLLAAVCGVVSWKFPQVLFLVQDWAAHIGTAEMPVQLTQEAAVDGMPAEFTIQTIEELCADERVSVEPSMALINTEYRISDEMDFDIQEYENSGVWMSSCIHGAYQALAESVRDQFGEQLYVRSAYRSAQEQQEQIDEQGTETATEVGASEHQAGLALDVYVPYYAGSAFLKTEAGQYVNSHCSEYGFIIRYPYYGEKMTGVRFEPWHIRYVGFPHAEIMANNQMTLEEYTAWFEEGTYYQYGDYLIIHQREETVSVPEEFASAVVSPDNMGGWWLTFNR